MARGDHIYVHCLGYSHHGIDLGDGRVVHFDYHPWQTIAGRSLEPGEPQIREVDIVEFCQNRPVIIRNYAECDDVEAVVGRAQSRLGETGYRLFKNNCEHFAVWCKTGNSHSTQIHDVVDAVRPVSKVLPAAAMLMRTARRLPGRLRMATYGAAFALTAGAFAHRYLENRLRRARNRES